MSCARLAYKRWLAMRRPHQTLVAVSGVLLLWTVLYVDLPPAVIKVSGVQRQNHVLRCRTLLARPTVRNGLGSQILRFIDDAAVAQHIRSNFLIDASSNWNYGCGTERNGWDCYFHQPRLPIKAVVEHLDEGRATHQKCVELAQSNSSEIVLHRKTPACSLISTRPSERDAHAIAMAICTMEHDCSVHHVRPIAQAVFRVNEHSVAAREVLLLSINMTDADVKRCIAVHIRRGDKHREAEIHSLEKYAAAIQALQLSDDEPVYLATDDASIEEEFRLLLSPRRIYTLAHKLVAHDGHNQRQLNRQSGAEKDHSTYVLLTDLHALVMARLSIGTFSSNLFRLAHVLRTDLPNSTVSLDTQWGGPGVAWRWNRVEYCDSPESNELYCDSVRAAALEERALF